MNSKPGSDPHDHFTDDQIIKKIIQLNKEIRKSTEKHGIDLSKIETQPLHWLWQQRILRGNLTILDGDPGLGKSLLALDLAARVTTGRPMPGDTPSLTGIQGSVILIAPEDGVDNTIKPRIEAAGGDPSRIRLLTIINDPRTAGMVASFTLPRHFNILAETIRQTHAMLVIIDPLMAILGPDINASRDQNIRQLLIPMALLAHQTNCAILIVRHLNKGSADNPLYRGSGSIGIIGSARAGLLVTPDPYDENKRILASTKNNLSAPAPNLTYQIIADAHGIPTIHWLGTNHLPITSLLRRSTILSPERQDILKALQESSVPLGPKQLAEQTGQHHTLVRQLLRRMLYAGDILSPTYGLYTLHPHPMTPAPFSETDPIKSTTLTTPTTPATVSHPDSNFAAASTVPATLAIPTTPATPPTVSHPDSNFAPPPTTPPIPHTSIETTIEQLSQLLHCPYTTHYLLWIFTPQKIGCPICDIWSTRDTAPNPANLALYAAISQHPPHESPSRAAWIELIAPSLLEEGV